MGVDDRPLNVAYLGPEASFSHQAAIEVFKAHAPHTSLHPLPSFAAIFAAIQSATPSVPTWSAAARPEPSYDYAVVPIENSTNGSVVQVLDLLAQCGLDATDAYPDLEVCAEYYLPVHHCLFTSPSSQTILADGDDVRGSIRTLYTHPQVWGQCNRFLSKHFPPNRVERIDVGSTSAAAQLVAREPGGDAGLGAAIASRLAGQRHGLRCLDENIEDEPGSNTTRFFVVRNQNQRTLPEQAASLQWNRSPGPAPPMYKSLITFTIPHTKPGALADALAVFKQHELNLTSIDTRPGRNRNWQYVFFVECKDAAAALPEPAATSVDEGPAKRREVLLVELSKFTERLRCLGTFVDQLQSGIGEGSL